VWAFVLLGGRARRTRRAADVYVLGAALFALFASTLPTALWRFGVDHPFAGVVLTPAGMVLFLLIHSITLSRAYVAANSELTTVNLELRRQVADRSQKLAEALARIEGVASVTRAFAQGDIVDDRYRIVRGLGAGGMGAVYEVARLSDEKHFALKVLRGDVTGVALSRFAREAEIAARIAHPNLVAVTDVDVAETGALFIVMELVHGTSLENARAKFGDREWARNVIAQIAAGLAALHQERVIHRDLKPGNVLIDGDRVKIADFGISALKETVDPLGETATPDAPKSNLTQTGALLGTPLYMAPELWRGADRANEASDMFSLGLVAYLLLAKKYPFDGPPIYDAGAGRTLPDPPPLTGVDNPLRDWVLRCLSFDPGRRPSAAEIANALRAD
jgi:serine/threonine protein kinase